MQEDVKIMLVEDNAEDVFFTRAVLRKSHLGDNLQIADNGLEAMAVLEAIVARGGHLPDIIFLDINLPVMGGLKMLNELKLDPRFSGIKVVMLTCSNEDEDIQKSYDLGANTYLVKPVSSKALMLVMESLF